MDDLSPYMPYFMDLLSRSAAVDSKEVATKAMQMVLPRYHFAVDVCRGRAWVM